MTWTLNKNDLALIDLALNEDLGPKKIDLTTDILFPKTKPMVEDALKPSAKPLKARIISKHPEPLVLCGLLLIPHIIEKLDTSYDIKCKHQDGDIVQPGDTLLEIKAEPSTLLKTERTILNFLQHLCAIATETRKFVEAIKPLTTKILDTRKTLPGFRHLAKYAVFCGGGVNHRMGLYDAIMIKDTHIDLLGGITKALASLSFDIKEDYPVIIEVRTLEELKQVLAQGSNKITRVLLDNMSLALMAQCVNLCRGIFATEASGNIDLSNVKLVAQTGVDFISIGKLTHSATHVDLSMKCDLNVE